MCVLVRAFASPADTASPALPKCLIHSTMTDTSLKVKRTVQKLTNGDRKWICHRRLAYKEEKFTEMQSAFRSERNSDIELKSGTVSGILKQSDKWLSIQDGQEAGTRTRSSKEPELEAALFAWRSEQIERQEKVRDEDLRDKARELAAAMGINTDRGSKGLSFSSGWLDRFKKRNCIKQTRYNRHGKKDVEKQGDLQHQSAFPQLSPESVADDQAAAPVGSHNPAAGVHSALPFMSSQMPSVMSGNVSGIPPVPHSLSMPQADGVPAAIPQPPGPSENDDTAMMHNNAQYTSGLFHQVPIPPVGHLSDAGGANVPAVPHMQQGMPLGPQQVGQNSFADVPQVPAPSMSHPFEAAMGIPAPVSDPHTAFHSPGIAPGVPPVHDVSGSTMITQQPQMQMCVPSYPCIVTTTMPAVTPTCNRCSFCRKDDPDIANIPPPAEITEDNQVV